jgi:hypothetical protein
MVEGWFRDEYYVLFGVNEVAAASARYSVRRWIPGYEVIGLRGWDDLLLQDATGQVFTAPCVPIAVHYASHVSALPQAEALSKDARYSGQIKWYVQPLVFGGSPTEPSNVQWVSHEQHGQLVTWWNERYLQLKAQRAIEA